MGDFEKIYILQPNIRKKKIPSQDHRPKKNSRTYSGVEKKFWQHVPCADTVNFCISKLSKILVSGLGYLYKRGIHSQMDHYQHLFPSDCFFFKFIAPLVTNVGTFLSNSGSRLLL